VCADFGAELVELDGEDDHVHLLVAYPPHVAVARLVNFLKGVSARRLRQHYRVRPTGSTYGPGRTSPPRPMAPLGDAQDVHPPAAHSWPGQTNPALNGGTRAPKIPVT
jgi:hypothetical protein